MKEQKMREILNTLCLFYGGDFKEEGNKVTYESGSGTEIVYPSLENALFDWLQLLREEPEGAWDSEIEFIETLDNMLVLSEDGKSVRGW